MTVTDNTLDYSQTRSLHIYGKDFEHVDKSVLQKVRYEID